MKTAAPTAAARREMCMLTNLLGFLYGRPRLVRGRAHCAVAGCWPLVSSAGRYRGWFHHHQRPAGFTTRDGPHEGHMTAHTIGGWPGWPVLAGDGVIGSASALLLGAFQPCRHRPLGYDPDDLGGGQ